MEGDADYLSDSSTDSEGGKKTKALVPTKEEVYVPDYTDDEIEKFQLFIQQISTHYELEKREIHKSFKASTRKWLLNILQETLYVFFDQGQLSACASCPTTPVAQLIYFLRPEYKLVFTLAGFHDEISFGTFHANVDETMLHMMNKIYAPMILRDTRWAEHMKAKLLTELHSFLSQLTDYSSQYGSMVIFYIPNEGHDLEVQKAVLDKALVKRYENVASYWIKQIRSSLSDLGNAYLKIATFQEENEFWVQKFDTLTSIEAQLCQPNILHIMDVSIYNGFEFCARILSTLITKVIKESQSNTAAALQGLRSEIQEDIKQTNLNFRFSKILIEPLIKLHELELPIEVPAAIPEIIYLIRVLSVNSKYYGTKVMSERLFTLLSNEVMSFCIDRIDTSRILNGNPRFGIKISDASFDCCLAFKMLFKRLVKRLQDEMFKEVWNELDEKNIFSGINAFTQRLTDLMDICETNIVFNRCDETEKMAKISFGCANAEEFELTCSEIEKRYGEGLNAIKGSSQIILDIDNDEWYHRMETFKILIQSLEGNVQSMLENIFVTIDNVEEGLDVLTTLYNFSKRKNMMNVYTQKVEDLWKMFEAEVALLSKDITQLDKERVSCFPKFAGKAIDLNLKLKRCDRFKRLLVKAEYLPTVAISRKVLEMFAIMSSNVKSKIEVYNHQWSMEIDRQTTRYLDKFLVKRSTTHRGLLECNIDKDILSIIDEVNHFGFLDLLLPTVLNKLYPKAKNIFSIYNKLVNVALIYNKIMDTLSIEERDLFKEQIKATDRKIAPGMMRLTYDDTVTDEYVTECLKHLDEVQHFVDIYKTVNLVTVRMFEEISNKLMLDMEVNQVGTLAVFSKNFKKARYNSFELIADIYKKVINYIIKIFEGFEYQNSAESSRCWVRYVNRIDALAEFAILSCARNTLASVESLLGGGFVKIGPFIKVEMTLVNKKIEFDPPLEEVISNLRNIHSDVIRSIQVFPRLSEWFKLPRSRDIRSFDKVVMTDPACERSLQNIEELINENHEITRDFMETWYEFHSFLDDDIETRIAKYEQNLKLEEFEFNMMRLVDTETQVGTHDASVAISFTLFDCSKLKEHLLDSVNYWKKCYKRELCDTTMRKLVHLEDQLMSRTNALSRPPSNSEELEALFELHKVSTEEKDDRKDDFDVIKEFYSVLEQYSVDVSSSMKKKFEKMPLKLKAYNSFLIDCIKKLENTKETFKLQLLQDSKDLIGEVLGLSENLGDVISSSSELSSEDAFKILALIYARLEDFERRRKVINQQASMYNIPKVELLQVDFILGELDLMHGLWSLVAEWEDFWSKYRTAPFSTVNLDAAEDVILSLSQRFNEAYESNKERKWDFLMANRQLVEKFRKSIPMYRGLQNHAMRSRHWQQIRGVTRLDFAEDSEEFNLSFIVEADLSAFADSILEIAKTAKMELPIENVIATITEVWETLKFEVVPHNEKELKIQAVDQCVKNFEEHLALIAEQKASPFVKPFKEILEEWEIKLSVTSEVLINALKLQTKWFRIVNIFRDYELRRKVRILFDKFKAASEEFREILKSMSQKPTAIEATRYKDPKIIQHEISLLFDRLEEIDQALSSHLQTKHNIQDF